jgi:hypothetical protein
MERLYIDRGGVYDLKDNPYKLSKHFSRAQNSPVLTQ